MTKFTDYFSSGKFEAIEFLTGSIAYPELVLVIQNMTFAARYAYIVRCLQDFIYSKLSPNRETCVVFGYLTECLVSYESFHPSPSVLHFWSSPDLSYDESQDWLNLKKLLDVRSAHIAEEILLTAALCIDSAICTVDDLGPNIKSAESVIGLMEDCCVWGLTPLPDLAPFTKIPFSENNGWGELVPLEHYGLFPNACEGERN